MTKRQRGRPPGVGPDAVRAVALRLFGDHGYDSVTLTQIAREAGVSRTTLFSMFPTKRDFMWVDHEIRRERLRDLVSSFRGDVDELLERAMLTISDYTVEEHPVLAQRHRLVAASAELQAYSALKFAEVADEISSWVRSHHPNRDAVRIDRVARALMAVASDIVREWAHTPASQDLQPYLKERLAPFVSALRPLLS